MQEVVMEVPVIHNVHPVTQVTLLVTREKKRLCKS